MSDHNVPYPQVSGSYKSLEYKFCELCGRGFTRPYGMRIKYCPAHNMAFPRVEDSQYGEKERTADPSNQVDFPLPVPQLRGRRTSPYKFGTMALAFLLATLVLMVPAVWAGTITGTIQKPNGKPLANASIALTLSQPGYVPSASVTVTTDPVYCGTGANGVVRGLADPGLPPALSSNYAAGTLPGGLYYVQFTYTASSGESVASPEAVYSMTSPGTLIVAAPTVQPSNATGYKIYIGATLGSEQLAGTVVGFTSFSQSTTLAGGAAPPVANSTVCSGIYFDDVIVPSYTTYNVNLTDALGKQVAGYPQRFYLEGTSVDLSTLTPAQNVYAKFPNAIVSQPVANALQSINGPLNLNGFALTGATFSSLTGLQVKVDGTATQQYTLDLWDTSGGAPTPHKYFRVASGALHILNNAFSGDILVIDDAGNATVVGNLSVAGTTTATGGVITNSVTGIALGDGVTVTGKNGIAVGNGGDVTATAGNGGATSGNGGNLNLNPGAGTGGGNNGSIFLNRGIAPNATGHKHTRGGGSCATAASVGAFCDITVGWATTFANANATPICVGFGITSGVPLNGGMVSKLADSVVFRTVAGTAAAAQYTNIYCIADHD